MQLVKVKEGTPPKAHFHVKWKVNDELDESIHYFRLVATPVTGIQRQFRAVTKQINDPSCRHANILLEPGITYTFSLVTYYISEGTSGQKSCLDECITAPTDNIGTQLATYYIHFTLIMYVNNIAEISILL